MNKIKTHLILIVIFYCNNIFAQSDTSTFKITRTIELSFFPSYFYNSVRLGFSWSMKSKVENTASFSFGNSQTHTICESTIKLQYNRNYQLKANAKKKVYLPVWLSFRRLNTYEFGDGQNPNSYQYLAIGTGIGFKFYKKLIERWKLEFGFGLSSYMIGEPPYNHIKIYELNKFESPKRDNLSMAFRFNFIRLIKFNN